MKDQMRSAGVVIPRDKLNAVIDSVRKENSEFAVQELVPLVQRAAEKDKDCLIAILNAWDWSYDNLTRQCISDRKKELAGNFVGDAMRRPARQGEERGNLARDSKGSSATSSPNDSGDKPGGGSFLIDAKFEKAPATHAGASGAGDGKQHTDTKLGRVVSRKASAEAACAVSRASRSIFKQHLGFDVELGKATKHHWVTARLKGTVMTHVADRMLTEIDWPDDVTPTDQLVSETQMKQILDSGYSLLGTIRDGRI